MLGLAESFVSLRKCPSSLATGAVPQAAKLAAVTISNGVNADVNDTPRDCLVAGLIETCLPNAVRASTRVNTDSPPEDVLNKIRCNELSMCLSLASLGFMHDCIACASVPKRPLILQCSLMQDACSNFFIRRLANKSNGLSAISPKLL